MYSSTCFAHPHAHYQELNNCSCSLWFYRWSVVVAVLFVAVGPDSRPDHAPTVKPEAATAVVELLMTDVRTPETCWAVHKHQVINLRYFSWLIYLNSSIIPVLLINSRAPICASFYFPSESPLLQSFQNIRPT
jgi:hypothetical protein